MNSLSYQTPHIQRRFTTSRLACATLLLTLACIAACQSLPADVRAQAAEQMQTGESTGEVRPPVYDAKGLPLTIGGLAATGPLLFRDITAQAGMATWRHQLGSPAKMLLPETDGSGVALLDYDKDGWLDIYLVNGSTAEAEAGKTATPHAALFHNNHDGTFTDVAAQAGVENDRWGYGVAVGDFDNDGWPDIYVANLGSNRLYRNNHDGTFTDVAAKAGVTVGDWSTGPTFGDYDGDGLLDLFVPGYVSFDMANLPVAGTASTSFHNCIFRGVAVSCGPRGLPGAPDHLFHNNGDGTFTDVSKLAGVDDAKRFYGFSSLFVDIDGHGRQDLLVANDSTPNYFYRNRGDGTFEDRSIASGLAFNGEGREVAGMGLAVGDYRNNGRLGVAITDFSDDYKLLFRGDKGGNFTEVGQSLGLGDETLPFLGWGVGFLDYDNDGWKDLMMFNGHVYPIVDRMSWGTTYKQHPLLFHNELGRRFTLVKPRPGSGLALATAARGAAFGDLFNDGRIDVVINNLDGSPTLLRNVAPQLHHWVEIQLIGGTGSPRDGVGATLFLTAGHSTQREDILSGGSFLSSNDQRAHFGLGDATKVDALMIHWPSGRQESIPLPKVDAIYTVEEGHGVVSRINGAAPVIAPRPTPRR